ncbi:acyl-CoA dehydrogenase family protein, partial [Streptomyces sp. SID10853]|uniref:acyl-CoA dehydrogenase family protein n=1 Tax=Streptomyces sp. SID10853 TaxID=2706028 RepID=UPI0019416A03
AEADEVVGESADARPVRSVDPLTPLHRADGHRARPPATAALLTAALQLGSAARTTELAVQYAKEREQFGRPIGGFQAVKHLCAQMLVRTEVARAAVYAAAVTSEAGGDGEGRGGTGAGTGLAAAGPAAAEVAGTEVAGAGAAGAGLAPAEVAGTESAGAGAAAVEVAGAKLLADDAAVRNARDCLQVHGGMGFTWESDVHLHLKRAWVRAGQWITGAEAEELIAAAL